jgi:hypothetical protein
MEACVCSLPLDSCHCRWCHIGFADRDEAMTHLSDRWCTIVECTTCGTPWWLSHVPGAPVPATGTWCICAGCGDGAIFTGRGLQVRLPTPAENERIGQDVFILQYREDRALSRRSG